MSGPATGPDNQPQSPGKRTLAFRNPFARTTKGDVAQGLSRLFSLVSFIFWPLGLLVFFLMLPFMVWRARHRIFPFGGRVGRQEFSSVLMLQVCLGGLLFALAAMVPNRIVEDGLFIALGLAIGMSALASAVGRLHDQDMSGWWVTFFYGLPAAIMTAASLQSSTEVIGFAVMIVLPFIVWAIIVLMCLRGTIGPNRFGIDTVVRPKSVPPPLPAQAAPPKG